MSVHKALVSARARPFAIAFAPWLAAAIALTLLLQLWLAFNRQINWDEFWFLARIYRYRHGVPMAELQTAYVHAFTWLAYVSDNVIGRIVTARVLMLEFEAGTFWLIYASARRFATREAALLGLFTYAALNDVFVHGAAFRADPIATFFLMASLALFLAPELTFASALAGAVAVAIAGLVTIKSAFYLPPIAAVLLWRFLQSQDRRGYILRLAAGIAASAIVFVAAYALHRASIAHSHADLAKTATGTAETVFAAGVFARTWPYMSQAILANPVTFAAILLGLRHCIAEALAPQTRARGLVLLAFAFPFATLFFYRNAYPYYYGFALAPAAVIAASGFARMTRLWERAGWASVCAIFLLLQIPGAAAANQSAQRATLAAVRKMFPNPVPYIDRCGMKSDYPRLRLFMSTWGLQGYRAHGVAVLRNAIMGPTPPLFVIVNTPVLQEAFAPGTQPIAPEYKLLPRDAQSLRDNYIHQWGAIWVAGKRLAGLNADENRTVAIPVAGPYTLEAPHAAIVDGTTYPPGAVIALNRGDHEIRSATGTETATLRYGDHLYRPSSAPRGAIFDGF